MLWNEVVEERGMQGAVAQRDGRIHSILCGSSLHKDAKTGSVVHYDVPNRPSYRKAIELLKLAGDHGEPFLVYWKASRNEWENLGPYRVIAHSEGDRSVTFDMAPSEMSAD